MRLAGLVGMVAAIAAVQPAAAATRDWSQVAMRTPAGTFVAGNPAARVKLVEYLSFTCPHCALMEKEAVPPLTAKYIRTGQVSYEVRHALRDGYDLAATMLARCAGPVPFFRLAPVIYAAQPQWEAKAAEWAKTAPPNMPPDKAIVAAAQGSGLLALATSHGLPLARARACLGDAAERKRLADGADAAWNQPGFPGTPDFLINGKQVDGVDGWPKLDAAIAAALKK